MIKSGKRPRKIEGILALTIVVLLIITAELATGVLVKAKDNKVTTDFAVMTKDNGLWLVNLSKTDKEILIDKGGVFTTPSISQDGQNVAYTKNKSLYVASIDLNQGKKESIKVSEQVLSYGWATSSDLAYSTEKGGLNGFNATSK
jgi:tricorn protease-like protein